uniref:Uncharacterized protein n=1 Tax=Rhabditophanes sp. KR3021 TaxID=114890 RepID=A0AC35TJT4_9BILA
MLGLDEWFYNFSQFFSQHATPENLGKIPAPYTEMTVYGTFKCAELGSIIGGLVAHPIYRIYLKNKVTNETMTSNTYKIIRNKCRKLQGRFLLAGIALGPLATFAYVKATGMSTMDAKDFCYKVRCDNDCLVQDRSALVMGFVGWYWKRFQGAVDGMNIGLIYAAVHEHFLKVYTSPLLVNKVKEGDRYASVQEIENSTSRFKKFISKNENWKSLDS